MSEEKIEKESSEAAPSGKNPLLAILVIVNTLAVGGVGFFQFKSWKKLNSTTTAADVMAQGLEGGGEHGAKAEGAHGAKAEGAHGAKAEGAHGAKAEGEGAKSDEDSFVIPSFSANLAQGEGPRRFIRISLTLKYSKETKKTELEERKAQISDTIISMLNAKRPEDLLTKDGKDYLKEELKLSINSFLVDGKITDVYYTAFQIN
jgi:flagellar FliL protein